MPFPQRRKVIRVDIGDFPLNIKRCLVALSRGKYGYTPGDVVKTLVRDALRQEKYMRWVIKGLLLEGHSDNLIRDIVPGRDRKKLRILAEQHKLFDKTLRKRRKMRRRKA